MLEKELQEQWLLFGRLQPTISLDTGEECKILDPGIFNTVEAGPDFLEAKLYIDGLLWVGSVEIHLKASDWNAHGHQNDFKYSNVVLHVVLELDERIAVANKYLRHFVFPNTPFLQRLLQRYPHLPSGLESLTCSRMDKGPYSEELDHEKEQSFLWKLNRKLKQYRMGERRNQSQVFYELLAMSFGSKVNNDCFWLLARSMPLGFLIRQPQELLTDWLLIMSGFQSPESVPEIAATIKFHRIQTLPEGVWKKKGVRPHSSPEKRVRMLAKCIGNISWENLQDQSAGWLKGSPEFLKDSDLSDFMKHTIFINACLPFAWYVDSRPAVFSLIVGQLKRVRKENNRLIRHIEATGMPHQSAYDSQALIGLYQSKCAAKKCLSCGLGKALMTA